MKISIITVVYNAVSTIEQTILSVLNQNYNELEYIIIDGGSTDGTLDIIRKYEKRITYWVSEADDGIYNAMNKGVDVATGDVIAFLNGDDWYEKDTLEYIAENLVEKTEVLIGRVIFYNGKRVERKQKTIYNLEELRVKMIFCHQGVFVRKRLFEQYGKFDEKYKIAADYDWLLRIYNQGVSIRYTEKILAHFSCSGASSLQNFLTHEEIKEIALKSLQRLEENGYMDWHKAEEIRTLILKEHNKFEKINLVKHSLRNRVLEERDINVKVKCLFDNKRKYSIFGCGEVGQECLELLRQLGIYPICFWDNGKSKWGTYFRGTIVKNPEGIQEEDSIVIIASTYYEDEIKTQLDGMGLEENIGYICYSQIRYQVGCLIEEADKNEKINSFVYM